MRRPIAEDTSAKPYHRSGSSRVTARTASSSNGSTFEPVCFGEWVYWQRDSEAQCWTKVFAVVDECWLCLYECEEMAARTLVLRKAMWNMEIHTSRRRVKLVDASDSERVVLRMWLMNHGNYQLWETCLRNAAQLAAPPISNDQVALLRLSFFGSSSSSGSMLSRTNYRSESPTRKREVVKAACKGALSHLKTRLRATWRSSSDSVAALERT
jgi:hypothetical protein|uniref:PH domain-containing protein n=1 Tax=Globisporangium ultimum (strain ATCC 200006 / CBS 805.95 / DAOM BR144) TaxID=431595 RepID=K3XBE7_GLOUD